MSFHDYVLHTVLEFLVSEIRGIPRDSSLSIDAIRSENRYFRYNFKVSIEERFFAVNSLSLALKK